MRKIGEELREVLGKALQEQRRACLEQWEVSWEERREEAKEIDRTCAEAVIAKYIEIIAPKR